MNMKLYFLVSSVTYGVLWVVYSFVDEIAKTTGWECIKDAICGATLAVCNADGELSYVARINKLNFQTNITKLIVQLSTNDAMRNVPIGALTVNGEYNTKTILGAIEYIVHYAKTVLKCSVTFITNPFFNNKKYEKMIEYLYEIQKKSPCEIIDFYYMRGMKQVDTAKLKSYMSDEIHPNTNGYHWMANFGSFDVMTF